MAAKTETPDKKKTNLPGSDQSARSKHAETREQERENWNEITDVVTPLKTSNNSAKHSSAEKLAASRSESSEGSQAQAVSGVFGSEDEESPDGATRTWRELMFLSRLHARSITDAAISCAKGGLACISTGENLAGR
jgi:hypothetical protein